VTVVTARAPSGGFAGLTVNSFSSLSLEPPLILWSITHASPSRLVFEAASHFAVNVLTEEQAALSRRFATPNPNKFAGVDINLGHGGAPLIAGGAATLECRSYSRQRAGDHWLLLGQVERFTRGPGKPLIFCMGRYWRGGEPLDPV
jgi:flavin reductase (DIM6/NTAB) family NADH-FMN oxidoreductase RutF